MSRLFKLKVWLSLDGAAKRLTESFGEDVSTVDVIQLALDGHLRLSLRLIRDLHAFRWYKKSKNEIEYEEVTTRRHDGTHAGPATVTWSEPIGGMVVHIPEFCEEDELLQLGMMPIVFMREQSRREIVDLSLTQYSRAYLLQCLDELNRPSEEAYYHAGRLLIQEENGDLWQVESYDDFLLDDIEIVVRTQALRDLEQSFASTPVAGTEKALSTRERDTLYKIIIGLAMDGHGYRPGDKRSTVAREVSAKLSELGIAVSDDTVRKYIKEAEQLLPSKPA